MGRPSPDPIAGPKPVETPIGVYEVIEAYRLPFYLAAAFERVVCAGRFGVPVRTDLACALAHLARLGRSKSPAMQPKPAPHAVQRRLPPVDVAARLVGAGKWPGAWEKVPARSEVAALLLLAVCQRAVVGQLCTSGPTALLRAAAILSQIVRQETSGRDVTGNRVTGGCV